MNSSDRSSGFTLIEVLIALVILSVALLGLAGLMVQTTKNTSFGGLMTEGATFAQDKLEELRATPWDNVNAFSSGVPEQIQGSNKTYNRSWGVEGPAPLPGDFDLDGSGSLSDLIRSDRSTQIGTSIPSGVIITFIGGTTVAYGGMGGGVYRPPLPTTRTIIPISWRIKF